jgi:hypothetical protein
MKRYVLLYLAPVTVAQRFAQATPEQAEQGMRLWSSWAQRLGPGLVDIGKPLGNAMSVTGDGVGKSDSNVIGMSIVQAEDMEQALAMARDHHLLRWAEECEIVVLEELPIPELQH